LEKQKKSCREARQGKRKEKNTSVRAGQGNHMRKGMMGKKKSKKVESAKFHKRPALTPRGDEALKGGRRAEKASAYQDE